MTGAVRSFGMRNIGMSLGSVAAIDHAGDGEQQQDYPAAL